MTQPFISEKNYAQAGDLAQLVSPSNKIYLVNLNPGGELQTHRGVVRFDDLIGQAWGREVLSHSGSPFFLLRPSLADLIRETRRNTQIMYPKEIGYILVKMGIGPGSRVLEAGTGSGAFTTALAFMVGSTGQVISYEVRPEMQNLARKNLTRLGLLERVKLKIRDAAQGFDEGATEPPVDALFLDLPNPENYVEQARAALVSGGQFGSLIPTTNQVSRLLTALRRNHYGFVDISEILIRHYKAVPERLRPTDRMVAHTGYLVFARPMVPTDRQDPADDRLDKEINEENASNPPEDQPEWNFDLENDEEDLD